MSLPLVVAVGEHPARSWGLGYLSLGHLFAGFEMYSGVPRRSQKAPGESCPNSLWFFWGLPVPAPCRIQRKDSIKCRVLVQVLTLPRTNFGFLTASVNLSFLIGNWQGWEVREVESICFTKL